MPETPVILITGASSGIGEATARLFARHGYRVGLAARRFERLQALASEIDPSGERALPIATDVSNLEDIQKMVRTTLDGFGQIDVLLNNAGFGRFGWLETLDPERDIESLLKVNLLAVIQSAHAVLPHMISRQSGHIINISSLAGFIATPTYSIYATSKFAVRGFTDALRREVGVYGIKVSGIYPGSVKTEFRDRAGTQRKTGITMPESLRLSAENVASAVLGVVRRPRRSVILPWYMRFSVLINALVPGLIDLIVERNFVRKERDL